MVRELTRERTEDFQTACAYERVFGSEILTLLRVYGLEDDQVRFYLEEQEGRPAAAIALQDRALWVSVSISAERFFSCSSSSLASASSS